MSMILQNQYINTSTDEKTSGRKESWVYPRGVSKMTRCVKNNCCPLSEIRNFDMSRGHRVSILFRSQEFLIVVLNYIKNYYMKSGYKNGPLRGFRLISLREKIHVLYITLSGNGYMISFLFL